MKLKSRSFSIQVNRVIVFCFVFSCLFMVGCLKITSPGDDKTFTHRQNIKFEVDYKNADRVKWTTEYTAADSSTRIVHFGTGKVVNYDKLALVSGLTTKHKITATDPKSTVNTKSIEIYIKPFCDDAICPAATGCLKSYCNRAQDKCVIERRDDRCDEGEECLADGTCYREPVYNNLFPRPTKPVSAYRQSVFDEWDSSLSYWNEYSGESAVFVGSIIRGIFDRNAVKSKIAQLFNIPVSDLYMFKETAYYSAPRVITSNLIYKKTGNENSKIAVQLRNDEVVYISSNVVYNSQRSSFAGLVESDLNGSNTINGSADKKIPEAGVETSVDFDWGDVKDKCEVEENKILYADYHGSLSDVRSLPACVYEKDGKDYYFLYDDVNDYRYIAQAFIIKPEVNSDLIPGGIIYKDDIFWSNGGEELDYYRMMARAIDTYISHWNWYDSTFPRFDFQNENPLTLWLSDTRNGQSGLIAGGIISLATFRDESAFYMEPMPETIKHELNHYILKHRFGIDSGNIGTVFHEWFADLFVTVQDETDNWDAFDDQMSQTAALESCSIENECEYFIDDDTHPMYGYSRVCQQADPNSGDLSWQYLGRSFTAPCPEPSYYDLSEKNHTCNYDNAYQEGMPLRYMFYKMYENSVGHRHPETKVDVLPVFTKEEMRSIVFEAMELFTPRTSRTCKDHLESALSMLHVSLLVAASNLYPDSESIMKSALSSGFASIYSKGAGYLDKYEDCKGPLDECRKRNSADEDATRYELHDGWVGNNTNSSEHPFVSDDDYNLENAVKLEAGDYLRAYIESPSDVDDYHFTPTRNGEYEFTLVSPSWANGKLQIAWYGKDGGEPEIIAPSETTGSIFVRFTKELTGNENGTEVYKFRVESEGGFAGEQYDRKYEYQLKVD